MLLSILGTLNTKVYGQGVCPDKANSVLVETQEGRLSLCQEMKVMKTYRIALGRGGVGKRSSRDAKTPIGQYSLGAPRASERFHAFIPIGYPTVEERKQGFTGQDIGIHGPTRPFKWAGRLNTLFGWTEGCVAVGSDKEIDEVATWVRKNHAETIRIR